MARGDFTVFGNFAQDLGAEVHDLVNDTLKLGIITTAVTPVSSESSAKWAQYSGNEVSTDDSQYSAPLTVPNVTFAPVSSNISMLDSSNIELSQNSSAFTDAGWGILYNEDGSSDQAIGFLDLGGPVDLTAGDITITPNSSGWLRITVS
jgi:hypothetical protein